MTKSLINNTDFNSISNSDFNHLKWISTFGPANIDHDQSKIDDLSSSSSSFSLTKSIWEKAFGESAKNDNAFDSKMILFHSTTEIPSSIHSIVNHLTDESLRLNQSTSFALENGLLHQNKTDENELEIYYFYKTETLTFLWILLAMILFGNCSVLITLLMSKNRKTRMNFFIMHLAIADLIVGLVNVSTDIAWKTTVGFYAGNIACKIVKFSQVFVTYSSTYVLVSLSIDRYDAITHPLNFSGSWTRAHILVGSAWGLSALFAVPAIFLNEEALIRGRPQCWIHLEPWQWQLYITLVALSLFFIPAIIITACYSIIVHTIWTKSKIMMVSHKKNKSNVKTHSKGNGKHSKDKQHPKGSTLDDDSKRASSRGVIPKAKIKTVKMTLVIVLVFILCWSPYFVWDLLQVYGYIIADTQQSVAISTFIQSLAPLNSAANPLIYCLFSTHFCRNLRKSWFSWICCCCPSFIKQSRDNAQSRNNYTMTSTLTTRSSGQANIHHNKRYIQLASTSASCPSNKFTADKLTINNQEINGVTSVITSSPNDLQKFNLQTSV